MRVDKRCFLGFEGLKNQKLLGHEVQYEVCNKWFAIILIQDSSEAAKSLIERWTMDNGRWASVKCKHIFNRSLCKRQKLIWFVREWIHRDRTWRRGRKKRKWIEKKKEKKKARKKERKKKGKQEIMSGNFGKDRGSLVEWGRVSRRGRNPNYTRERAEKEQNKERKKK